MDTARTAKPITGDKPYQERARAALPLLVRQAEAATPILYSDLAAELGMANPRNLNFVLGSIGQSIELLSNQWAELIPPIQCLVVNKTTGLPGEGVGWFVVKKEDFAALPIRRKRELVQAELQQIYNFSQWREVLTALELTPATSDFTEIIEKAREYRGSGESQAHKALKEFVAERPEIVGLLPNTQSTTEYSLLSGDRLDVSFRRKSIWVAAEVKAAGSPEADLVRGILQCVKYLAIMEAVLRAQKRPPNARAVLVLEDALPPRLVELKNLLGVEVVEGVVPADS